MLKAVILVGTTLSALTVVAAGCSSAGGTDSKEVPTTGTDGVVLVGDSYAAGQVQETVVRLQPDGSKKVSTRIISADDAKAEEALRIELLTQPRDVRQAFALTHDTSCASADMWLYNSISATNCPAEICFYNNGVSPDVADLTDYNAPLYVEVLGGRCITGSLTWEHNVGSYYSGDQDGCLGAGDALAYPVGNNDFINIANYGSETTVPSADISWIQYLWLSASTTSGDETSFCFHDE